MATPPKNRSSDCAARILAGCLTPKSIRALAVTSSKTPFAQSRIRGVTDNGWVVRSAVQDIRGKLNGFPYAGLQDIKVRLCLHSEMEFASNMWSIDGIEMRMAAGRWPVGIKAKGPRSMFWGDQSVDRVNPASKNQGSCRRAGMPLNAHPSQRIPSREAEEQRATSWRRHTPP
jgi:hypothetical protein